MPEEELSKMLRPHRHGKSSAAGVVRFFISVEVALEARPTAVMNAGMPANEKPIEKLKNSTAQQKKVKKHIVRQRIAAGWDWVKKINKPWMIGLLNLTTTSVKRK